MWWVVGIALFATLSLYCGCVAGSNADDSREKWWKEHTHSEKGDGNNANQV